jgi:hypothetical protein
MMTPYISIDLPARENDMTSPAETACAELAPLSPLEARVVRLAASNGERPADIAPVTRAGRLWRRAGAVLLARRPAAPLADARLEALRSYVVAVRTARPRPLADLVAAGYSEAHARCIDGFVAARAVVTNRSPAARAQRERVVAAAGIMLGIASIGGFIALTGVAATLG